MDEGGVGLSGRSKAAILCVALGPANAAEVFHHLSDDVIEQLTVEMAKTPNVDSNKVEAVITETIELAYARGYMAEGGLSYARDVLERAVGERRATEILGRLARVIESTPFEFLRGTAADQIFAFLRNESSQTIALVVANMPATDLAAQVLQFFPPEQQAEIAMRVALMNRTSPDVVKDVARVMKQKLETVLQHDYAGTGGVHALAEILNQSDRATERNILDHLAQEDTALAEEVRALLFVFEDILALDDRSIQLVLKEIDSKDLALALRGASDEVKDKLTGNMSQRAAEMLREEMEYMPPQRRSVVEEAQTKIVAVVRKLEDSGAIVLSRGAEEDELVA
jgi:flagellar motor switch protein FliG